MKREISQTTNLTDLMIYHKLNTTSQNHIPFIAKINIQLINIQFQTIS